MFNADAITLAQMERFEEIAKCDFGEVAKYADTLGKGATLPPARVMKGMAYLAAATSGKDLTDEELGAMTMSEITALMTEEPSTPTAA